jgi:hypothetical protein
MLRTYKAILKDNCVEWVGEVNGRISKGSAVPVHISLLDESVTPEDIAYRGKRMVSALNKLAEVHAFADIADPGTWEREIRLDRQLPGRHDAD